CAAAMTVTRTCCAAPMPPCTKPSARAATGSACKPDALAPRGTPAQAPGAARSSGLGQRHPHLPLVLAAAVAVADFADVVLVAFEEQHLGAAFAGIDACG